MWFKNPENSAIIGEAEFRRHFPNSCFPQVIAQENIADTGFTIYEPPAPPPAQITPEQIIGALWNAANEYQSSQISGAAIGLLTIGVLNQMPKCLAVQAWIKSVWSLYYERKALFTEDYDFTVCGPMPHTVPELMAEVGV